ncbi:hypothetical protein GCM10009558_099890 [Virgisporangium aurantiacum]
MTAGELTDRVLAEFCADLRSVWQRAGGPGLRALGTRTLLSKSQVGAILAGRIRRPPDWDVVRSLVGCFREYAERHASTSSLAPGAATEEYWRSRYTVIEQAFRHGREHDRALDREHDREHGREVTVRRPTHPRHRAASPVPRQLPSTVGTFVGRVDELATLTGLPATTTLVVIDGMAGIGKTTLALTWARRAADRFPDGQLYLNLRGFDPDRPATDPTEALHDVVCALGVPPDRIPTTVDGRAALFRSLLAGRRTLLILDNARDSEQVRPLLPGAPGCLTVVTSRNGLAGLVAVDDARPMTLGPLSGAEASTLLAGGIGTGRVAAEPAMADRVVAACAALPLALAVAAAHAATRPNLTLADLAAELTSELTSELTTDVLDPGDLDPGDPRSDLWAVFSWSYRSLAPDAARLFRLLTLYPGHDVGVAAGGVGGGDGVAAGLAGRRGQRRGVAPQRSGDGRAAVHHPRLRREPGVCGLLAVPIDPRRDRHRRHRSRDHRERRRRDRGAAPAPFRPPAAREQEVGVQPGRWYRGRPQQRPDVILVADHVDLLSSDAADTAGSTPRIRRSMVRPRLVWLFTFPSEQRRIRATSPTGRSQKNRRTSTVRWAVVSWASASRSESRSST